MYAAERHSIYRKPPYSDQHCRHDKVLLGANLRQNNGMVVLNAVSDGEFHCV